MRWVLLALLLITCTSSMSRAQQQSVTETLINPWYYCVGKATGRQPDRFKNPEMAVERGFEACRTEEMAVQSFGAASGITEVQMTAIIVSHRSRLKQSLVSELSKKR